VSFLPPLGFTTNWCIGCNDFRLGKIDNSSVAEKVGKINWSQSGQSFHNPGMEIPTGGIDNRKVVDGGASVEHVKATLSCIGDAAQLHG